MTLVVNGEKIEDSVIQQELERLRPDYERIFKDQSPAEQEKQLLDWSRENVIERVLINQEAKNNGEQIPADKIESVFAQMKKQYQGKELPGENKEKIKQEIELQIKIERMLENACKDISEPSQEAVLEFYEQNKERFKSAQQVRVSHIVKYINWQADERAAYNGIVKARDQIKSGRAFELVVDEHTDCGDKGGDLGYITRGQMVEEFEDVVFKLNVNEVSDIFRTRFGFHIAKVYDRKPAEVRPLKEVRAQIVNELKEQMRRKAIENFVDGLKSKAKIEQI